MRKLKVMHLILSMETGGTQTRITYLANMLSKEKFDFFICCFERIANACYRLDERVKVFLMYKKPGVALSLITKLRKLLIAEKIDIVHTHGFNTLFYGVIAAVLAGVPVRIHGEQGDIFGQTEKKHLMVARKVLSNFVNCIVVNSNGLKSTVKKFTHIREGKFKLIYNGIDTDKFKPAPAPKKDAESGKREITVGTVGRVIGCKNQKMLIEAMAIVKSRLNNVKAVIIGDGPLRGELEKLSSGLHPEGCVDFMGKQTDVPKLLSAIDIFALTSFAEGCSNAMLEAMSCGLPVIASDSTGNKELVEDGVSGILFSLSDVNSLAEAIISLVQDRSKREGMGQASRERAERLFSLKQMIKNYSDLYIQEAERCIKL